jgi:uncharacterized protein with GYD domain
MAKYVILVNWTEQGIRDVKSTQERAQHVRQLAQQLGGKIDELLWTLGRYDLVGIAEMPDDETAALMGLRIGGMGSVRTETLRAFTADEMGGIVGRLG